MSFVGQSFGEGLRAMQRRPAWLIVTTGLLLGSAGLADDCSTPQEHANFAEPQFISTPLGKAYPGLEYNIRPAIKGGRYPYTFDLAKGPEGMAIDKRKGTIRWTAPNAQGRKSEVEIKVTDSDGKAATQSFKVLVSRRGFYFVTPQGDDAADGSIEHPWRTVMRAAEPPEGFAYPAGATVYLRGGEHKVKAPPRKPGAKNANVLRILASSPKRWIAYPGERPTIDLGWSAEQQKAALDEQRAAGKKRPTSNAYGHRIYVGRGADGCYFDGLEIKNACYYMFVMWDGQKNLTWRRCDFHHLYADYAENPSFIFTFAVGRKGDFNAWGVRPKANHYRYFVIQDNHFRDRLYDQQGGRGGHGGAMTFYTVRDAVVEDNLIERIHHGSGIHDKDSGWGNTYRNNRIFGSLSVSGQWCNDEIAICHNFVGDGMTLGWATGWVRNIWVHHNTIRGTIRVLGGANRLPPDAKLDEKSGDFSGPGTEHTRKAIREASRDMALVNFYRNILAPKPGDAKSVVVNMGQKAFFATRYRYVNWDENLIDKKGRIHVNWGKYRDWSLMTKAGFDARGVIADVELDADGNLPAGSPYLGRYGRQLAKDE